LKTSSLDMREVKLPDLFVAAVNLHTRFIDTE